MKKLIAFLGLLVSLTTSSYAALDVGDAAPNFTAQAALAGKVYKFSLADSLAKGPVVLYFFPAAFSVGCSIEAHEFAESIARHTVLNADRNDRTMPMSFSCDRWNFVASDMKS